MASILVVDDSAVVRRMLGLILERTGHLVTFAANGDEGLAELRARRPDLIISDLEMPVMDGVNFVRQLRADPGSRAIPVIMLTASGEAEDHRTIADMGIAAFATKPLRSNEVIELVSAALESNPRDVPG
jgi:CheY-like chemotaxis protein